MAQSATWVPYSGADAILLAIVLLVVGCLFAYMGIRLKRSVGIKGPGKFVSFSMITLWILSIVTYLVASSSYLIAFTPVATQLYQEHLITAAPKNPISSVTYLAAIVTFAIIAYATRKNGWKIALGSAFIAAAVAAMIFELPFDLIVMSRTYPPVPPSPTLYRLLFFLPLFLVEISTFSFLALSPLTKLSKYTLFSAAAMFFVFAVWALFGFSYPSDLTTIAFNGISKVLAFVTAITLFVNLDKLHL
jgi:hypothetical protein